ncbi:MAG: Smr/MutS family protein [Treponema sp.]|nr:Smr/MutS family protein [Treponema sp.]
MDFGDILNQWDKQEKAKSFQKKESDQKNKQVSHKKANADFIQNAGKIVEREKTSAKDNQNPTINPMELWLRRYGVTDKDAIRESSEEASLMKNREYISKMHPEARIDLHGNTRDEAWARLESFVNDAVKRGLKKIEIVHGKGIHSTGSDPVLGPMVRTFIEQNKHLGVSGHNDRNHGGSGATWVLIK